LTFWKGGYGDCVDLQSEGKGFDVDLLTGEEEGDTGERPPGGYFS